MTDKDSSKPNHKVSRQRSSLHSNRLSNRQHKQLHLSSNRLLPHPQLVVSLQTQETMISCHFDVERVIALFNEHGFNLERA